MGVEDPEGREDIVEEVGLVDLVVTVEVEDQVGMVDIMVAMEGIIPGMEDIGGIMEGMADIMVVMAGSFPDYLSAVS